MKKFYLILGATCLSLILLGCQQESESEMVQLNGSNSSDKEMMEDEIVDIHGEISNLDRFEEFIENVNVGSKDEIRIKRYTIEGDPIFYHLNYDGEYVQYTYDNSQDGYAGSGKGIVSTSCSNIESKITENGVEYRFGKCSSEVGDSFYFVVPQ